MLRLISSLGVGRAGIGIVLAVLAGYLLFFRTTFLVPDSSGTYAWCRSLVFDRDVDFGNELDRLGAIPGDERIRFHRATSTGRPGNPFGMGSGLLWAPFVLVAEAGLALTGEAPRPPGYSDLHLLAASTGTVIYGLAALLLTLAVARRFAAEGPAVWAVAAGGFGTPFFAYLLHLPTYSHVNAAFAAALALLASLRAREMPGPGRWALAGAAAGLAAVIRAQNAALLILPLVLWASTCRHRERRRAALPGLLSLLGGFVAVFAIQVLAWWRIYGSPWEVPQGEGFLDLLSPRLLQVLFSPWHGLFPWSPVLLLVLPGLVLLFRRDPYLAGGAVAVWGAETWLAASVPDWWAGYAVGARRFVDLTPLFILALACTFHWLRERVKRGVLPAVALTAVLWNLLLTLQVRTGLLSPFREVGLGEMLAGQGRALVALPGYLWGHLTRWPWSLHLVVHRDSPVSPAFDPAPGWLFPLVLGACWVLGLSVLGAVRRGWRRGPPSPSPQ